jgi:hypothetical protein
MTGASEGSVATGGDVGVLGGTTGVGDGGAESAPAVPAAEAWDIEAFETLEIIRDGALQVRARAIAALNVAWQRKRDQANHRRVR